MPKTPKKLTYKEQMEFNVFEPVTDPHYQKMMDNKSPPIEGGHFWKKMQKNQKIEANEMIDRSSISEENNRKGYIYQEYVAEHLEELTGKKATITKSHGIDVICAKYNMEVKGTQNFFQITKKGNGKVHMVRGWKTNPSQCPAGITHFAFVLAEKHLCTFPIIYVVPIEEIMKRFNEFPHSQWVKFAPHWVWNHYDFALSKIPLMEDTEEMRKILLNSEKGAENDT